jgi:hypothetical protein
VPSDEEIHNALVAIHSRLGLVEGKVNLVARANRPELLATLAKAVREKPLIGQIYLLLDGKQTQQEMLTRLQEAGIQTSQPTVSRRLDEMKTEHGIAEFVRHGVLQPNAQMEQILNLSTNVRRWLDEAGEVTPEPSVGRKRTRTPK